MKRKRHTAEEMVRQLRTASRRRRGPQRPTYRCLPNVEVLERPDYRWSSKLALNERPIDPDSRCGALTLLPRPPRAAPLGRPRTNPPARPLGGRRSRCHRLARCLVLFGEMSVFNLQASFDRAAKRFGSNGLRRRRDRGQLRLEPRVLAKLESLLSGQERPPVRDVLAELQTFCEPLSLRVPARATIYQAMAFLPTRAFPVAELPAPARETLYNVSASGTVPGHQLAFYCFNYGGSEALSFAAGLPWLALYQAARLPGWRARSRGLLDATLRVRGISR